MAIVNKSEKPELLFMSLKRGDSELFRSGNFSPAYVHLFGVHEIIYKHFTEIRSIQLVLQSRTIRKIKDIEIDAGEYEPNQNGFSISINLE